MSWTPRIFIDDPELSRARDARLAEYWARKRGDFFTAATFSSEPIQMAGLGYKRLAPAETAPRRCDAPAQQSPPVRMLGTVRAGDKVKHSRNGKVFVVLEDLDNEVAVKGENSPRLVFLKSSLVKP